MPPAETKLAALIDNIRSAWNVGSIFRTADGLGVSKLYLCGITPTPDSEAATKTSLGAEKTVAWEYSHNALETAKKPKSERHRLIALEQGPRAMPISALHPILGPTQPKDENEQRVVKSKDILILGNEVTGIDVEILDFRDQIVHIPMRGHKRSLNVEVAFAIAAYSLAKR